MLRLPQLPHRSRNRLRIHFPQFQIFLCKKRSCQMAAVDGYSQLQGYTAGIQPQGNRLTEPDRTGQGAAQGAVFVLLLQSQSHGYSIRTG